MDKQPILSICIPTNGIVEWMIPVVESIYAQNVNNDLFEVVITDNGGKDDLEKALQAYDYPNLHYFKTTSQGFTNQIDAFEKCSGLFCKMLNHRSKMMPGSIEKLIALVERYKEDKPIIYCAEGHAIGGEYIECASTDEFVNSLSYFVSWSAGAGAWRDDLTDLRKMKIDRMFPHTVFLFELRNDSRYVIWNEKYEVMGDESGKGGYDLFQTFCVNFLDILNGLRLKGRISQSTFIGVKCELLSFMKGLYLYEVVLPTKRSFVIGDIKKSLGVYYGKYEYRRMVFDSWVKAPYFYFRSFISSFFRKRK